MISTKNVQGNRQVVVADCNSKQFFKIPDGLDLEDKTVVEIGLYNGENFIFNMSMVKKRH